MNDLVNDDVVSQFLDYPFDTDEEYKQGLSSLFADGAIDPNSPPEIKQEMILKTKVFYFSRVTGMHVNMEQIKQREPELSTPGSSSSGLGEEKASRILTFAELQDLIESGKLDQIPNNKTIPDKLHESFPSTSKASPRKKPWESDS